MKVLYVTGKLVVWGQKTEEKERGRETRQGRQSSLMEHCEVELHIYSIYKTHRDNVSLWQFDLSRQFMKWLDNCLLYCLIYFVPKLLLLHRFKNIQSKIEMRFTYIKPLKGNYNKFYKWHQPFCKSYVCILLVALRSTFLGL